MFPNKVLTSPGSDEAFTILHKIWVTANIPKVIARHFAMSSSDISFRFQNFAACVSPSSTEIPASSASICSCLKCFRKNFMFGMAIIAAVQRMITRLPMINEAFIMLSSTLKAFAIATRFTPPPMSAPTSTATYPAVCSASLSLKI